MKSITVFFIPLFFSISAFAADGGCVDAQGHDITNQPDQFQTLISHSQDCYSAKSLAEACAWGSSMDVQTAGAAYAVCSAQLDKDKPADSDRALLKSMEDRCNAKYDNMQGTLYMSENAYCHLSAIGWLVSLDDPEGNG